VSGNQEIRSPIPGELFHQPAEWLLDCAFVEENAAGLVLGALDQDETTRIHQHLAWCPGCARLVHEQRKTVNYLPFVSPQAAPSASVKSALFARIAAQQSLELVDPKELWSGVPTLAAATAKQPGRAFLPAAKGAPGQRRRFNWDVMLAPLAAVPLVVALAIVGGWALRTQDRLDTQAAQVDQLEEEKSALLLQVDLLSPSGDAQRLDFESADSATGGGAGGSITAKGDSLNATISVWNLPESPTGYQIVLESESGGNVPALVFMPQQGKMDNLSVTLNSPLDEYTMIHIRPLTDTEQSPTFDSPANHDVLWLDLNSNLGSSSGTEANARAH
jgi:hypothetical protein